MRAFLKSPLFIALAIAVACIFSGDDRNVEHPYWNIVFKLISEPAPDTAMIVSLDEGQGGSAGLAVNSSALQAQVVDRLLADGAQRIFLDFPYSRAGDPDGDAALKRVLGDAGSRVVLVNRATYEKPQPHLDVPQFQPAMDPINLNRVGGVGKIIGFSARSGSMSIIASWAPRTGVM